MRYVVAFEEVGEDSTGAEGIGIESDENEDGWGERMMCLLKVNVELREEGAWEVHCCARGGISELRGEGRSLEIRARRRVWMLWVLLLWLKHGCICFGAVSRFGGLERRYINVR